MGKPCTSRPIYDDRERYLTVEAGGGLYAIRFETHEGGINTFYAGAIQQVRYVEGCLSAF